MRASISARSRQTAPNECEICSTCSANTQSHTDSRRVNDSSLARSPSKVFTQLCCSSAPFLHSVASRRSTLLTGLSSASRHILQTPQPRSQSRKLSARTNCSDYDSPVCLYLATVEPKCRRRAVSCRAKPGAGRPLRRRHPSDALLTAGCTSRTS